MLIVKKKIKGKKGKRERGQKWGGENESSEERKKWGEREGGFFFAKTDMRFVRE